MRIGIYCSDYQPETGGASTLTQSILREIEEYSSRTPEDEFIILYSGKQERGEKKLNDESIEIYYMDSLKNRIYRIIRKIDRKTGRNHFDREFDRIAKEVNLDIIWFCNPVIADISIPYIYTVWDLGHRTTPFFPEVSINRQWEAREKMYTRMIPEASWVVTGNETGKREIAEHYAVSSERFIIAPFPVSSYCRGNERKPSFDISEKYFFYPAQFWAHKNHIVILEALAIAKERYGLTVPVYFSGSDKGNKAYIAQTADRLGVKDQIVFTGFLTNEEMKYMYTHAVSLVYASLMGPNNLPPIEAVYLGCPVILTDLPGHTEQLGDAAMYFDGTNADELAHCMMEMMNPEIREQYVKKASEKKTEFDQIKYCKPIFDKLMEFKRYRKCWQ